MLVCHDGEFPELARRLVDEGARIVFVPFRTDRRQGYMRVPSELAALRESSGPE